MNYLVEADMNAAQILERRLTESSLFLGTVWRTVSFSPMKPSSHPLKAIFDGHGVTNK